ncbi:helix-turn-helix transcriptional regulator [Actinomadura barringtoniae]|uniref:Helix-turn-helix transcriptional regulator n=1 Tax=Actinomadura barringtoniae TaxID=1427535 RepID=A0A939P9V2_9ACTN|nr:helix-turn-helix transcriptional regulator [Actinomadura barringtoniae]MBO2448498.1 helix-turn-helix transcriptional regulator [Actinomadura barringtoniae]
MSDQRGSIGGRIASARKLRGLTQGQLAERVPCSKSLIAQVERGHKPATQALVAGVARALRVGVGELTGQPYGDESRRADRVHAAVPDIRRALLGWDLPDEEIRPRAFDALAADVERASALGRQARYGRLGEMLPGLLEELTAAVHGADHPERLYALLAEAYTGATAIAYTLGYFDLRSLAMERVDWAARASDDPLRIARTQWQRSTLFLANASYDKGGRLLARIRHELGEDVARMDAPTVSVYGAAHLRSAIFAARTPNAAGAWAHIGEAWECARLLGEDANHYGLEFGPSNVAIHEVAVAVELYDGAEAVRRAGLIRLPDTVAPVRLGHYYIDLARGFLYNGNRTKSLEALQTARRAAPQQTRNHPMVRETVRMLVDLERRRPKALSGFASWVGMP